MLGSTIIGTPHIHTNVQRKARDAPISHFRPNVKRNRPQIDGRGGGGHTECVIRSTWSVCMGEGRKGRES